MFIKNLLLVLSDHLLHQHVADVGFHQQLLGESEDNLKILSFFAVCRLLILLYDITSYLHLLLVIIPQKGFSERREER